MRNLGLQAEEQKWLVYGDLNEILFKTEKKGDVMDELGLKDLGVSGYDYTWTNQREGEDLIEEKLDRAIATGGWMNRFPEAKVVNLIWDGSDHIPIMLLYDQSTRGKEAHDGQKLFRFEAKWLQEEEFDLILKEIWEEAMICWHEDLIRQILLPHDVERILSTPLSRRTIED
ncbi:Sulfotransferase family cytosolic 1B member 1 [Bienertia sinuspersici]